MTKGTQTLFFATAADMRPGVERIEATRPLKYAVCDLYETAHPQVYRSLLEANGFGTNASGQSVRGTSFIVVGADEPVHLESVPQRRGGVRHLLTQAGNARSIVVRPSGMYRTECLVSGMIGTVSDDSHATTLYRDFVREVTRGFKKLRMYLVGPEALRLLEQGWRLVTMGVDEPPEYDLRP